MHRNDISASTQERWRTIPDFPSYDVSDLGRVRSRKYTQPRVMKPRNVRGYRAICLRKGNRSFYLRIARLVLETFVGPPPEGHEAAHLDGSRTNDVLGNLAWVTHQENVEHKVRHGTQTSGEIHAPAKVTASDVEEMFRLREAGASLSQIANYTGFGTSTVHRWISGAHTLSNQWEAKR